MTEVKSLTKATSGVLKNTGPVPFENENQLKAQLLGIGSNLNSFTGHDSASREQMWCSHIGQSLVIEGSTPRRIQTGAERELGKFTFDIKMPVDAKIIKLVQKYPKTAGAGSIRNNPVTAVIYEDINTNEIGVLMLTEYHTLHTVFGFKYKYNGNLNRLNSNDPIPAGTIIASSPSIKPGGQYAYGIEANVAYMSIPQVIEDGFVVRRGFLKEMKVTGIDNRVVSWGKEYYPLNLYGDENNYQPFPNIGERVRSDGLIFALRKYDVSTGITDMTTKALMEVDYVYDQLTYAEVGALVTDVTANHDFFTLPKNSAPVGMNAQVNRYANLQGEYYKTILKEYYKLKRVRGDALQLTPQLHQLIVDALADDPDSVSYRVTRMYRRTPLDDWRVDIQFSRQVEPTIGYKPTDGHGSKGVFRNLKEQSNEETNFH